MTRKSILALMLLLFVPATSVYPLGLTDIELSSEINEPLDARIPFHAQQSTDMETIQVGLADAEHFIRANLERLPILGSLRFEVIQNPDGTAYIRITTNRAINEPFLSFIVEVNWSRGRILREYTLLLDPPTYTSAASTSVKEAAMSADESATVLKTTKPSSAKKPAMASTIMVDERFDDADTSWHGPVTANDTLWSIATRLRADSSVSIEQMMLLLQWHNPEAFLQNNINTLKEGAVLRVPNPGKTATIPQYEALAEVKRQHVAWEEFRQRLAANPAAAPSGSPVPSPETKADATETGQSGRIEILSAGSAKEGTGQTGQDNAKGLQAEIVMAKEEIDAKSRENKELRSRLTEAEELIQEFVHLMEIQSDEINALKNKLAETESAGSQPETPAESRTTPKEVEITPPSISEAGKQEEAVTDQAVPDSPPSPVLEHASEVAAPEEPSLETTTPEIDSKQSEGAWFSDRILRNPMIIAAGLGAIIILLIAGGILWLRRRGKIAEGEVTSSVDKITKGSMDSQGIGMDAKATSRPNKPMDSGNEAKGSFRKIPSEQKTSPHERKKRKSERLQTSKKKAETDIAKNADPSGIQAPLSVQRTPDDRGSGPSKIPPAKTAKTKATEGENLDLDFGFDLDSETSRESPVGEGSNLKILDFPSADMSDDSIDEMQTKLDLAQAYIDMGDAEGARSILDNVLKKGGKLHQNLAKELLGKLD
uniref:FimV N-terminal domain-containing protein n=1 Tax=Candidatus Kentrum sp. SD TaxID=2126332 RepID=A0A451BHT7_9GAMM|nr:MAG: FimV N-terminal domain-containing protein [Candidatus Kentron sp. SD]VFK77860.1 MAG: FimV N-terminal domain-containing protein [Candidatus Kentron sp. SD]